jgi:hypothetical protein
MKEQIKEKLKAVIDTRKKFEESKKELRKLLNEYAQQNRIFAAGETVIVCDRDNHTEIGKGIVGECKTYISWDTELLMLLEHSINNFERSSHLCYEIFGIKADGKASQKHLFQAPHYISNTNEHGEYYIKKLA